MLYRDNGKEHGNYYLGFRFYSWGWVTKCLLVEGTSDRGQSCQLLEVETET